MLRNYERRKTSSRHCGAGAFVASDTTLHSHTSADLFIATQKAQRGTNLTQMLDKA
jgi:hypothetical protein